MKKLIALAAGALIAYAVVISWPDIMRYRRMVTM
jgi:hypothetical protein